MLLTAEKNWDSPIQLILSPYFGRALKTGSIQIFLSLFQTMLSPLLIAFSVLSQNKVKELIGLVNPNLF